VIPAETSDAPSPPNAMVWRTSPARSRRAPPTGFVVPCQPFLVARPPVGPGWLHEIKHDGYRIVARTPPSPAKSSRPTNRCRPPSALAL
jgi:hypothetical protein